MRKPAALYCCVLVVCLIAIAGCQRNQQPANGPVETQQPALTGEVSKLIEQLNSQEYAVQAAAAVALAELGGDATPAVDALIVQLKNDDSHVRAHAARALGLIGKPALPAVTPLTELVTDDERTVRLAAVRALGRIGPGTEISVPLMIKVFSDANSDVVALAAHTLAEAGSDVVPAMINALDDERTAYWAILVLEELGADAKQAVPALAKALSHEDVEVRHEAAQALRAIGPDAKEATAELMQALDDEQVIVRMPAVLALGSIGPEASGSVEKLRILAESKDDVLQVCALWAIEKIEPNQNRLKNETTPALVNYLLHEQQTVRHAAGLAIVQLRPGQDVVAPLFAEVFDKASGEARADVIDAAAAALGNKAIPQLIKGLAFADVRRQVIELLGKVGPDAAEAVPALLEYVDNEDSAVRADVLLTLGYIGPAAAEATAAATHALQDSEEEVQSSALYALGNIGPAAADSVDEIKELMDRDNSRLATIGAWALIHIDSSDADSCKRAIPKLITALGRRNASYRIEAASTLGMIGPAAKESLPALKKMADENDTDVRQAAADAIKHIRD